MERIVIRSSNWLGDAVMTVPAVRAIRRGHPAAHIAVLAPRKLADVWRLVSDVNEVIGIEPPARIPRVARSIRGKGFTMAVIFPNSLRTGLEMWLARIPRRVGYAGHAPRSWLLTEVVGKGAAAAGPPVHQVHHYLALAGSVGGLVTDDPAFGFPAPREIRAFSGAEPAQIAVCPGAEYGPAKRWLPERYAEVIKRISASGPVRWKLVGTAKDHAVAAEIDSLAGVGAVENLAGGTTLAELIELLRGSDVLLTNDTGTMHLAALLGVRTVSIFGSTEPALTGPLGSGHTVLRKRVECSPCFLRECPIDFRCMKAVEVSDAAAALRRALGVAE